MIQAIKMVTKVFEITVIDNITRAEHEWFELQTTRYGWDVALTKSGRILMVEGPETIYELIEVLAEHEFVHDIGLIREVINYEPQYADEDMHFVVEFDND